MASAADALRYGTRLARRGAKWTAQRLRPAPAPARPLYVVGCQRSGTTMLMDVFERAPFTWVHQEYDRRAYTEWKLRPRADRERLLDAARAAWVVFKPLYDAQRLDVLLAERPDARAIWVHRDWRDVASSSARKWGDLLPRVVERLVHEDDCDHWMADRLPAERRERLATFLHPDLSVDSAAALRWWLRNEVWFDLELASRGDRVLSLHYESLVSRPDEGFEEVFAFLGTPPDPSWWHDVNAGSVGRGGDLDVDAPVAALCEELSARIARATGGAPR